MDKIKSAGMDLRRTVNYTRSLSRHYIRRMEGKTTRCIWCYRCIPYPRHITEVFRMVQLSNAYIDGLVRDCSNPNALAMDLLQSCTKPSIWSTSGRWANQLRSPEQIGRGNCGENIFKWIFLTRNSGGEYQLVRSWWYIKLRSGTRLDRAATDFLVHF